jgi:hypothetical protein
LAPSDDPEGAEASDLQNTRLVEFSLHGGESGCCSLIRLHDRAASHIADGRRDRCLRHAIFPYQKRSYWAVIASTVGADNMSVLTAD